MTRVNKCEWEGLTVEKYLLRDRGQWHQVDELQVYKKKQQQLAVALLLMAVQRFYKRLLTTGKH